MNDDAIHMSCIVNNTVNSFRQSREPGILILTEDDNRYLGLQPAVTADSAADTG